MNIRQEAARGIFWSVVQKWGREGISFITFVILSRLLGPEAFGLVALATVFTVFVQIFIDQGFGSAIVQINDLDREHLDTAFWVSILTGTLLTVGGIASAELVAGLFNEPRLQPVLVWLSAGFLISALSSTQIAILRRNLAFRSLAIRSLIATAVGGIVGIAMAFANFGVWSLVGQNLANALAGAVVLWWASDWRPSFRFSRSRFKTLFNFGIAIVGNDILDVLMRRGDDFLIGYFLGPTLLGYYTIGYRLLLVIMRVVTGIINSVAFPTFSRIQDDKKRMLRAFYKMTQYTSLLSFPVFIGMALVAPELVRVLFGDEWLPSIPVMQVLALIGLLQSVMFFNDSIIKAAGKPEWQFAINLLTAVSNVIGFLIVVRWGIVAVAASFVTVSYLIAPVSYIIVRRLIQLDFKTYLKQFGVPLLGSLAMVLVLLSLRHLIGDNVSSSQILLLVYVAAGGVTYFLVILITANTLIRQILDLALSSLPFKLNTNLLKPR